MLFSAVLHHHHSPSGPELAVLIVIAILYVGWRTGRLGRLRAGARASRLRGDLREQRLSPFSFVPLALLVIVVVVLLIAH